jgi:hypothetical protein
MLHDMTCPGGNVSARPESMTPMRVRVNFCGAEIAPGPGRPPSTSPPPARGLAANRLSALCDFGRNGSHQCHVLATRVGVIIPLCSDGHSEMLEEGEPETARSAHQMPAHDAPVSTSLLKATKRSRGKRDAVHAGLIAARRSVSEGASPNKAR